MARRSSRRLTGRHVAGRACEARCRERSGFTGLKDPELTEFMVFCHFSYYDLIRWSREEIISTIRYKFDEYQYYKAIQDMDDY